MGFFSNFVNNIVKNSSTSKFFYDKNSHEIKFELIEEKSVAIKLSNPIFIESHNSCTSSSYTLKDTSESYGSLFIEYLDLFSDCEFAGEPRSVYQNYVKDKLRLTSLDIHKKFTINECEFIIFVVNDEYFLNFVHIYDYNKHAFVLDLTGRLFTQLSQSYKLDFKMDEHTYQRVNLDIDIGIVKDNHTYGYIEENSSEG